MPQNPLCDGRSIKLFESGTLQLENDLRPEYTRQLLVSRSPTANYCGWYSTRRFRRFQDRDDGGRAEGLQSIMIKQLLRNGTRIIEKDQSR